MSLNDNDDKRDYKEAEYEHAEQRARRPSAVGVTAGADANKTINPLKDVPKATLLADVDNFCSEYGLGEHVDTFKEGALVAQAPDDFEAIEEVAEEDKAWLRKAQRNKWAHPRMLYFTGMYACLRCERYPQG